MTGNQTRTFLTNATLIDGVANEAQPNSTVVIEDGLIAWVGAAAEAYMTTMMSLPAWQDWHAAGERAPWIMPGNERD